MPTTNQRTYRKKININIIQPKSRQPLIANWIAGIAALVTFGVFIINYRLFEKTSVQAIAALKADSIAERSYVLSYSIYKSTDSSNKASFIETKRVNDSTIIENRKRSKRDSLSLNAQIQTLKETKNEFEIDNQPFLQVLNVKIDTLIAGKPMVVSYKLYNHGVV